MPANNAEKQEKEDKPTKVERTKSKNNNKLDVVQESKPIESAERQDSGKKRVKIVKQQSAEKPNLDL